jgi:hypothetical protein
LDELLGAPHYPTQIAGIVDVNLDMEFHPSRNVQAGFGNCIPTALAMIGFLQVHRTLQYHCRKASEMLMV